MTSRAANAMVLCAAILIAAATGTTAQNARFSMVPVEGGALRLDTHTGAVALCGRKDGYWLCEALPEEREALRREIDRLREENAAMQEQLDAARAELARNDEPAWSVPRLPTDQDLEQMMGVIEKMMRRFQDMIESLKQRQPPPEQL